MDILEETEDVKLWNRTLREISLILSVLRKTKDKSDFYLKT